MHTIAGGSSFSSLYIWYSDDPLGVVSSQGDFLVPSPFTFTIRVPPDDRGPDQGGSYVRQAGEAPEATGRVHRVGGDQRDVEVVITEHYVLAAPLGDRRARVVEPE